MGKKEKKSRAKETPPSEGISDSDPDMIAIANRLKKMEGWAPEEGVAPSTTFEGTMGKRRAARHRDSPGTEQEAMEGTISKRRSKSKKEKSDKKHKRPSMTSETTSSSFAITTYDSESVGDWPSKSPRNSIEHTSSITAEGLPPLANTRGTAASRHAAAATELNNTLGGTHHLNGSGALGSPSQPSYKARLPNIGTGRGTNSQKFLDELPLPSKGDGGGRMTLDL